MQSGFNTNFRYRGVLFHVQTEDSGLENPHVISHLFHGGNIMASEKREYSELIAECSAAELEDAVRKLMESQHKSMLKRLSRGEHDPAIEQRMGADVFRAENASGESSSVTEQEPPEAVTMQGVEVMPGPSEPAPEVDGSQGAAPADKMSAEVTQLETGPPHAEETESVSRLSRVFGDRVVSEKPLDEVVLDYLVENARKRKRSSK